MKIDLFECTRRGGSASGLLALIDMQRIETSDRSGAVAWKASFESGRHRGHPRLDLAVDGTIELVCQRCLQPMQQDVTIRSRFLVVPDEETAARFDDDDAYDAIVGAIDFDFDVLIEDEVVLALPIAPRHEVCPDADSNRAHDAEKISPFAALAGLKAASREDIGN